MQRPGQMLEITPFFCLSLLLFQMNCAINFVIPVEKCNYILPEKISVTNFKRQIVLILNNFITSLSVHY